MKKTFTFDHYLNEFVLVPIQAIVLVSIYMRRIMKTQSMFRHLIFIICLLFFSSIAYADDASSFSAPICAQPFCKVYTVINPTDNVQINVSDWSAASPKSPAILFIHGYPHDQFLWLNQINSLYLRNNFRIITIDWRGFGLSDKPTDPASYSEKLLADDINAVLNQLNINRVVLVGERCDPRQPRFR